MRSNGNSVLNTKRLTKIKWWPHGGLICTHWIYRKIESLYVDRSRECGSTIQNARKCDRIRPRKNVKFVEPVEMTNGWYDINKTRPVLWSVAACGCCAFFLIFFFFFVVNKVYQMNNNQKGEAETFFKWVDSISYAHNTDAERAFCLWNSFNGHNLVVRFISMPWLDIDEVTKYFCATDHRLNHASPRTDRSYRWDDESHGAQSTNIECFKVCTQ